MTRHLVILLALFVAVAAEAMDQQQRKTDLANNNVVDCYNSQNGDTFPDIDDCSAFYSCWNREASLMKCGPELEYNSDSRQCDYPLQQPTNCRRTSFDQGSKMFANLCENNPTGNSSWAFLVAHPTLCNSYFTCSPNIIHKPCHLCAEGTYFPQGGRTCMHLQGVAPEQVCEQGRRFVQHQDKPMMMTSPECTD